MDYQRLKYFLKAAESASFSDAAKDMFITPQAFGRQIALFEEEIGFKLFDRTTRNVKLTTNGKICYDHFSTAVKNLEYEYEKMRNMSESFNKTINIAFYSPFSKENLISPIVIKLMSEFSGYEMNINILELDVMARRLDEGSIDVALVTIHEDDKYWRKYNLIKLKEIPAKIAVSLYHKWVVKEKIDAEEMRKYDFLQLSTPDFENDYFNGMPCKKRIFTPNYDSLHMILQQGQSFTIFSEEIDDVTERKIKVFPLDGIYPSKFNLDIVYGKNNEKPFLKDIIKAIEESI